jgi:hypothetical protein
LASKLGSWFIYSEALREMGKIPEDKYFQFPLAIWYGVNITWLYCMFFLFYGIATVNCKDTVHSIGFKQNYSAPTV